MWLSSEEVKMRDAIDPDKAVEVLTRRGWQRRETVRDDFAVLTFRFPEKGVFREVLIPLPTESTAEKMSYGWRMNLAIQEVATCEDLSIFETLCLLTGDKKLDEDFSRVAGCAVDIAEDRDESFFESDLGLEHTRLALLEREECLSDGIKGATWLAIKTNNQLIIDFVETNYPGVLRDWLQNGSDDDQASHKYSVILTK